ncbi:MAG: zinc ribbon domain-containing protein [Candidatus Lokiarchaeota archaeon]|nr:zinc ribbon domain-containing protein [Candidatus Lokiarchaeota archaeon]
MLQNMFPFDIFGFFSGFFILIFIIVIVIFVIVILIIYKLLHTNVDNVKTKKKALKTGSSPSENKYRSSNEIVKEKLVTEKKIHTCKYCGERIEDSATFCPFCGSNLIT